MNKIFQKIFTFFVLLIAIQSCHQKTPIVSENKKSETQSTLPVLKTNSTPTLLAKAAIRSNKKNPGIEKIFKVEPEVESVDAFYNDVIEREKYEFELLKDPATGKIPEGVTERAYSQARSLPSKELAFGRTANVNTYIPQGPDNLGGRTRALAYDVRFATNQVIIAGSVSSGVMRSANGGASWTKVSGTANIHDITCIAQDPRPGNQDTWYLGTGEALGNSTSETGAFRTGFGIYKSIDNGLSWTRLNASNTGAYESFDTRRDLISKVVVDPTNGNVYIANLQGISRSTDGGATWSFVLGLTSGTYGSGDLTDVVCSSGGVLYAAISGTTNNTTAFDGVWRSTTGDANTWSRIAGNGSPTGWKTGGTYGRVVLALAPSNENILYALYDNKATSGPKADFFKYDASTTTWSANRSSNLPDEGSNNGTFDHQGGYDLFVSVKPDDPNFVIIAGVNAYTSTDAFNTATSFKRIGGYAAFNTNSKYANHHPDVHIFAFEPGSSIKMASGDDGGIQVTPDVTASSVNWNSLNNSYQTYQYYYTAIDPTPGSDKYIGGAQDNGTTYRNVGINSMSEVLGGDGVSVGISKNNAIHYMGFQNGVFYRRTPDLPPGFINSALKPSTETGTGLFVTLFYLNPDNTEDLYYANSNRLWRNTGASTATTAVGTNPNQWQQMTGVSGITASSIRCFATTRGEYNSSHCLYMGYAGRILRLTDPRNANPSTVPTDITPSGLTSGSTVIDIAIAPNNPNIALAVVSNYGAISVFFTTNVTASSPVWVNAEGNLTLPSFRSCAIVEKKSGGTRSLEYYVGTSVGLYSTTLIDPANPTATTWVREGTSVIDQAVVRSLPMRHSDNTMLVGTHGNGMFVSSIGSPVTPVTWAGTTNNNWDVATNWSPANVPAANDDVVFPTGASNYPVSVTGTKIINNITLQNGASLNVSGVLQVTGTFLNNGTLSGNGTTSLTGTTFQSIAGSGSVSNVVLNNSAGAAVSSGAGNMLNITGVLTLTSGLLTTNGNVTLKSNSSGTGSIGTIASGLSGNVTVERYTSNKRAWRLLGIPFASSSQTIKSAWMEGATTVTDNPNPGFGTQITTFTGDGNAGNFDAQKPASSIRVFRADNFNSDAAHTPSTISLLTSDPAYFLFVRGDRAIDRTTPGAASSSTVLRSIGAVNSGNVTTGVPGTNFSLIPNPYPSPVDFDLIKGTNTSINTFYIWDASLGGTDGVGQYRTVTISGSGPNYNYTVTPSTGSDNNRRFIESGAAFMIPGSTTVNFTEVMKKPNTPPATLFRTTSPAGTQPEISINLNVYNKDNTTSLSDGVREIFDNGYSLAVDKQDAKKIEGFEQNLAIANNNEILAVEKRPMPSPNEVINLKLWNAAQGNYQFEVQPANFTISTFAYLKDSYLNTFTPIDLQATTKVNFSITGDAASAATNRFSILFTNSVIAPGKPLIVVYPNPVQNGVVRLQLNSMPAGIYQVRVLNALGQMVLSRQIKHAEGTSIESIPVNRIKGTFMLEIVKPDNSKQTEKIIIN